MTWIFSPKGIGKTLYVHHIAVQLAKQGKKVLLIDTDNPRRIIRKRFKSWVGFDSTSDSFLDNIKILDRTKAPQLTKPEIYNAYDFTIYDLVIFDSFSSTTEGIGEKDSANPSKALSPLINIAHTQNGPSVLVCANTTKDGSHGKGNGNVMDRADITYEVRDPTGISLKPNWIEQVPESGAKDWKDRSQRRNKRSTYRLAFICTKYRDDEEPDPFITGLDLRDGSQWEAVNVSAQVEQEGIETEARTLQEIEDKETEAVEELLSEIKRRDGTDNPVNHGTASHFLNKIQGLTRERSRELVTKKNGVLWTIEELEAKQGKPKSLRPLSSNKQLPLAETSNSEMSIAERHNKV